MSRREQIEAMLADAPTDAFLRYGLAMEMRKSGEHAESVEVLAGLQKDDPPYIPAFLMAAQQLVELDQIEDARAVLRNGIEAARAAGDGHAAGEMSELLSGLGQFG